MTVEERLYQLEEKIQLLREDLIITIQELPDEIKKQVARKILIRATGLQKE